MGKEPVIYSKGRNTLIIKHPSTEVDAAHLKNLFVSKKIKPSKIITFDDGLFKISKLGNSFVQIA